VDKIIQHKKYLYDIIITEKKANFNKKMKKSGFKTKNNFLNRGNSAVFENKR